MAIEAASQVILDNQITLERSQMPMTVLHLNVLSFK